MCLALLRRGRRQLPSPIRRIGLLNTAAIGDTVLMSGPLADLREAYRDACVLLFVGSSNYEAARILTHDVDIVRLPVFDLLASVLRIRRQKLDVLLDFGPWARLNAILTALSGAKFTAGFQTAGQYRHYAYDLSVEHSPNTHELENHRKLMSAMNIRCHHQPRIPKGRVSEILNCSCSKRYVVFHQWAGGSAAKHKEWPILRWQRLAEYFVEKGYDVVLTGSSSQRTANDRVIDTINPNQRMSVHNQAGLSLAETSTLIVGSALVVSVDTGVMHLASAFDARLVALMGPASHKRWGPIGKYALVVESPLDGCGYLNLGFEIPPYPPKCMEAISFDAVRAACEKALLDGKRYPCEFTDEISSDRSSV
jgi:ADP-heptose:LPS heptosyltransferase